MDLMRGFSIIKTIPQFQIIGRNHQSECVLVSIFRVNNFFVGTLYKISKFFGYVKKKTVLDRNIFINVLMITNSSLRMND